MTDLVKRGVSLVRSRIQGDEELKATDLLRVQHREVDLLFARIKRADSGRERRALVIQLAEKLKAHMVIEQEIFYPACQRDTNQGDMVAESFEEHAVATFALQRLLESESSGKEFEARLEVLKELVHHHVMEEEGKLLPKVSRQMSADRLHRLGAQMKERFDEVIRRSSARAGSASRASGHGGKRMAAKKGGRATSSRSSSTASGRTRKSAAKKGGRASSSRTSSAKKTGRRSSKK